LLDRSLVFDTELRLLLVLQEPRVVPGRGRYGDQVIEPLYGLNVAISGNGNAVFSALELHLEVAKVFIGLQIGIAISRDRADPSPACACENLLRDSGVS